MLQMFMSEIFSQHPRIEEIFESDPEFLIQEGGADPDAVRVIKPGH